MSTDSFNLAQSHLYWHPKWRRLLGGGRGEGGTRRLEEEKISQIFKYISI
jgi:hypothetical protein